MTHQRWTLIDHEARVLGYLTEDGRDDEWIVCRWVPTEHFAAVAHLFAEELGVLEEDEMDSWDALEDQIEALGLMLQPDDGGPPLREFLLHVDGERAWFRT